MMSMMEIQNRIRILREELENRHKYGTVKLADNTGVPVPAHAIQSELYSLIYKLSKLRKVG